MVKSLSRPAKNPALFYMGLGLACALAFALLTLPIALDLSIPGDVELLDFAMSLRNNPLTWVIQLLSFASSSIPATLLCCTISFAEFWRVRRLRSEAGWALWAFLGHTLCNVAARSFIGRLPPEGGYIGNLLPELWTGFQIYAYPSGHAGSAVVAYGSLAACLWPYMRLRRGGLILALLVGLGAGLGRVYLGVHWPSDVLGGYLLGGAWLAVGLLVRQRYNH